MITLNNDIVYLYDKYYDTRKKHRVREEFYHQYIGMFKPIIMKLDIPKKDEKGYCEIDLYYYLAGAFSSFIKYGDCCEGTPYINEYREKLESLKKFLIEETRKLTNENIKNIYKMSEKNLYKLFIILSNNF